MTPSQFDKQLEEDTRELQKTINKLLDDFDKKYAIHNVSLFVKILKGEEVAKNGGLIRCTILQGMRF